MAGRRGADSGISLGAGGKGLQGPISRLVLEGTWLSGESCSPGQAWEEPETSH